MARDGPRTDRELIEETLDRARRTETRVTKIANHLGVEAGGEKPRFDNQRRTLHVPNRKVSLDDVVDAIRSTAMPVKVYFGDDLLMTVNLP
jgi:hypothetical protein